MASTDAKPLPIKSTAFRVTFPILDNTGALVTGAAGLDSEVSKDGGTFADCTNEATEIATASGIYYLDLTSTEMGADTVSVIVKTSTTNAKTTVLVFYPQESGDIKVDLQTVAGTTQTARDIGASVLLSSGTGTGQVSLSSGLVTLASAQTFNNTGTWTGNVVGTLSTLTTYTGNTPQTGDAYARLGAPTGASIAADVQTRLATTGYTVPPTAAANASAVRTELTTELGRIDVATSSRMATYAQPTGFLAATFPGTVSSFATGGSVVVTSGTVTTLTNLPAAPTDWLTAAAVKTDAVTKIQSGLSTYAGGDTSGTTTLLARIPTFPTNFSVLGITGLGAISRVSLVDVTADATLGAAQAYYAPAKAGDAMTLTSAYDDMQTAATQFLTMTALNAGSYRFTAAALALAPAGGSSLTQADIRTAIGMGSANLDTQLAAIAEGGVPPETAALLAAADQVLLVDIYTPTGLPSYIIPDAPEADLTRIYGYAIKIDGTVGHHSDVTFTLTGTTPLKTTGGAIISSRIVPTRTNRAGYLQVDLLKGYSYRVDAPGLKIDNATLDTTDETLVDLADLIT